MLGRFEDGFLTTNPMVDVGSPRFVFSLFVAKKPTGLEGSTGAMILVLAIGVTALLLIIVAVVLRWTFGTLALRLLIVIC